LQECFLHVSCMRWNMQAKVIQSLHFNKAAKYLSAKEIIFCKILKLLWSAMKLICTRCWLRIYCLAIVESRDYQKFERHRDAAWWWSAVRWSRAEFSRSRRLQCACYKQSACRWESQIKRRTTREIAYENHSIQYLVVVMTRTETEHSRVWSVEND